MAIDVDVIIPHYGATPELHHYMARCLDSIVQFSDMERTRVIVVDNGSPADHADYLVDRLRDMPRSILLRNYANEGFVAAVKQGIANSTAPHVVLLNNDAEAAPRWIELLHWPFTQDPHVAISGPLSTDNGWQGRYRDRNPGVGGWCVLPRGQMLAFFCAMLSRVFLARVGLCHDAFAEYGGFGGDDWLCHLAQRYGYHLALQRDLVIPHARRTTFRTLYTEKEISKMQSDALDAFKKLKAI
jgi:GT2 family glycosyltransferase